SLVPICLPVQGTMNLTEHKVGFPAYGQYFTSHGVAVGGVGGFEDRPVMIPNLLANILLLLSACSVAVIGHMLINWLKQIELCHGPTPARTGQVRTLILLAASTAQILLMLPWLATNGVYDRYILLIAPGLAVFLATQLCTRLHWSRWTVSCALTS